MSRVFVALVTIAVVITSTSDATGISVLLVFGIKVSALLYLAPVFLASSLFFMLQRGSRQPSARLAGAIAVVLALIGLSTLKLR